MNREFLSPAVFVYTDGAVSFGQDALALARFCNPTAADTACDLGTGCGVIPLLWAAEDRLPHRVLAVERERVPAALAARSVSENGLFPRITVEETDWNALPAAYNGTFSLVSCNPPYFKRGNGKVSPNPLRAAARTEEDDRALPRLMQTAARLLTADGRFCFCIRPEREADVIAALDGAALQLTNQTPLANENGEEWLTLYCAKRRNAP